MNKKGDLSIWWIPQVPMDSFRVDVSSVEEGVKILNVLADYDLFQYENRIKPDYANAGGLLIWEEDFDGEGIPGWVDWYEEYFGFDDPEEWLQFKADLDKEKTEA